MQNNYSYHVIPDLSSGKTLTSNVFIERSSIMTGILSSSSIKYKCDLIIDDNIIATFFNSNANPSTQITLNLPLSVTSNLCFKL